MTIDAKANQSKAEFPLQTNSSAYPSAHPPLEPNKRKVFVLTHGCQMNEYDSKKMADVLGAAQGYERTDKPEDADLLLMNTCSIREKAQEKVFSELGRWRKLKEANPNVLIGVGGCVASQEGDALRARAPVVDIVFGPQTLHRLPQMVSDVQAKQKPVVDVSFPEIEKFDQLPEAKAEGATAFVSIMEGCSKYCTFCVVPYTRGEEISRPFDDVIAEVAQLAAQDVKEVNLLGQNVNAYRGAMHDGSTCDLGLLIHYVAEIDGIERIRFTTSHPVEFTDSLVDAYANVPQLADYLHLPVQSGCDRILAQMKRGHTTADYIKKIKQLRSVRPNIGLSSDFIVGFPGETDEDFQATMDLIEEIRFDQSFSFVYSPRPGTPAAVLVDNVPKEVKMQRLNILQARINEFARGYSEAMVGTHQRILVQRHARKNAAELAGKTENNRWVNFEGPAYLMNQFVDVEVTEALPNSLRGRIIDTPANAALADRWADRVEGQQRNSDSVAA